jgi:hypothetical protein
MKDFNRYHILFLTTYQKCKRKCEAKDEEMYKKVGPAVEIQCMA